MSCTIQQLTYSYRNPEQVRQLNLCSSSNFKIYTITHLDSFVKLRTLILSNNMIRQMAGLDHLRNLRLLNLEFNQIRCLSGTQNLANLEELYLSYNQIQVISQSVLSNRKLRILHLAYNDIANLDSISVLYQYQPKQQQKQKYPNIPSHIQNQNNSVPKPNYVLSQLTTLSLLGNPIISTINYLSFFKMMMPSLRIIDDKSVEDDQLVYGGVCPQQEVFILRQAINKLLDQRNAAVQQLQTYAAIENKPARANHTNKHKKQIKMQRTNQLDIGAYTGLSKTIQLRQFNLKNNKQILKYLQITKHKYLFQVQNLKQKISNLSQNYTDNLKKQKDRITKNQQLIQYISPQQSQEHRYGEQEREFYNISSRQILKHLKEQEQQLQNLQLKIKNINKIVQYVERRQKVSGQNDIYTLILQMVLFGYDLNSSLGLPDCQKLIKKYLIKPIFHAEDNNVQVKTGLIQYSQLLKKIIYGQNIQGTQIKTQFNSVLQLKSKIKKKGLLQIITQLKESSGNQISKNNKFEQQRKNFIQKFQKQTEQLSRSWDQLKQQKTKWQSQKQNQQRQIQEYLHKKQKEMRKKYRIAEEQQRQKVIDLKNIREKLENQLQRYKIQLSQTQQKLNRRFLQLQQFQNHFNQFIGQKQHIKSLSAQIDQITIAINQESQKYQNLRAKVKQLSLQEGILQNRMQKLQQTIKTKSRQLNDIEKRKNQVTRIYERNKEELDRQVEKLRDIYTNISNKAEQLKDYQRLVERNKKNYTIMQQKVRNIQYMQTNKKLVIKQLQQHIKALKQDKQNLISQINSSQKTIQSKRQQLIKIQLKIQQNKLAMQSLTDINKSVSDMMIRQSELKRNIIELQIQNKNLMDMKNNLLQDFRIKQYM